ncbi:phosphoribosylformylglycinamidine synthase subunit PurS [Rossellomorea marisflavi]|jgi:phosphoribosylformylglycinamidine synthase subunit PurS|uniref:phosphoribosylformylglycinamidine synthase subunit PurS n=1 Tax=Rossellomorea marisflavi TaxID=189381 RepID=UPI00115197CF|nr:phosphoribosylformylglycinamidine synthase subunit PurS [Rossellomorea marisflavi]MDR4938751.1 phosphoribosylformylglycinamidine synthase subunit PurS [Rossellomorea marisflavi]VXC53659.1 factor required for phosphoribosylformylglycinamidine synthetase activity [Bacillus sp. 349Y]
MYKVKVYITLRESVLDPQGSVVKNALHSMEFTEVEEVRVGKYMELSIPSTVKNVEAAVEEMCHRLLANPVIEDYRYEIEESVAQ